MMLRMERECEVLKRKLEEEVCYVFCSGLVLRTIHLYRSRRMSV